MSRRYQAGVHFLSPTVPLYVIDGPEPGPTALVQAGIHGDEVAGVHALQELVEEGFAPARGRLLLVPCMNPAAYRRRQRAAAGGADMNRSFPGDPRSAVAEERMAARFMQLILDEAPALVATLHESDKRYHPAVRASFGQTLVYGVDPCPAPFLAAVERLNQHLEHPYELWDTHYYPVSTSSTEVIVEATGCLGVCVETWKGFTEERRIAMQREVVGLLLAQVGLC